MKNMEIIQIDKLGKTKVEPETHKINFNMTGIGIPFAISPEFANDSAKRRLPCPYML